MFEGGETLRERARRRVERVESRSERNERAGFPVTREGRRVENPQKREIETEREMRDEEKRSTGEKHGETRIRMAKRVARSDKGGILEPGPALKYTPREIPSVN